MTPEELVTVKYALVCAWTAAAKNEPISARVSDQMLGAILLINEKLKFQKAGENSPKCLVKIIRNLEIDRKSL